MCWMIDFSNFMKWRIEHMEKQQINQPLWMAESGRVGGEQEEMN